MLHSPKISVYQNASPTSLVGSKTVASVVATIRTERFKPQTLHLRQLADAHEARIYKAGQKVDDKFIPGNFWAVSWTGELGREVAHTKGLQLHTGLICIDWDELPSERIPELLEQLRADEYTHIAFISPSGNGIKVIVRTECRTIEEHKAYYAQLTAYYASVYQLTTKETAPIGSKPNLDPQCKNPNRLCFLPHDPDAFYNPESSVMALLDEYRPVEKSPVPAEPHSAQEQSWPNEALEESTRRLVNDSISLLQQRRIDLTQTYEQWLEIGFAFASLGEEGRIYFHQVSALHPAYDYPQCNAKFTELLQSRTGSITIGTFLRRCEEVVGKTWQPGQSVSPVSLDKTSDAASISWEEPQPLVSALLPVLPVVPSMLPQPLRARLMDIAYRMKCPLDFVAAPTIVALSSLIGSRLTIKPKQRDDWTVIPNLWGAVIGDPSTMKTPSMTEVLKPLNRLSLDARSQYEAQLKEYEAEQVLYDVQRKVYQQQQHDLLKGKDVGMPVEFPTAPTKPTEKRYMTNDATIEKIADLLNENPAGLLVYRDEVIGILAGWNKPGHEQDRALYLEGWNGGGSMSVDRMGRGTTHVKTVSLSLLGGIQPSKLVGYLQAATGYENDGFVQRLQLAVYPDKVPWEYIDETPDTEARKQAYELINAISESDFTSLAYPADDYNSFPFTRFEAAAQQLFKDWLTDWETNVMPQESGLLLEHFTKYRSLLPSLALIFHVVDCIHLPAPADPSQKYFVSVQATQMAIEWCAYLQSHARRIYGLLDTVAVGSAKELLRHLRRGALSDGLKARHVTKKGWTGLTTTEQVEAALAELVAHQWLKEVKSAPPATGRPDAPHYLIHPKLFRNT